MTEELDGIGSIDISCHPCAIDTGVGAEVHHSERAAGGAEEYPAGVGGVDIGIDKIDGVGGDSYGWSWFGITGEECRYETEKEESEGDE